MCINYFSRAIKFIAECVTKYPWISLSDTLNRVLLALKVVPQVTERYSLLANGSPRANVFCGPGCEKIDELRQSYFLFTSERGLEDVVPLINVATVRGGVNIVVSRKSVSDASRRKLKGGVSFLILLGILWNC